VDELLVDLWNSVLAKRATALFEMSMTAAESPSVTSVGALFDSIRDTTLRTWRASTCLLTARRIPTLNEEVEPFVQSHFQLDSTRANAIRLSLRGV